jgi:hypothetical protein
VARVVVSGYIVRYPVAGNVWAHFQYVLGLHRLGHEVWFVEDSDDDDCFDPVGNEMTDDASYGIEVLRGLCESFEIGEQWAYRDIGRRWHGLGGEAVAEVFADADLLLDVGGTSRLPEFALARRRAYVDMDPVFTQLGAFGAHWRLDDYDVLFTYGANTQQLPSDGRRWLPLRPPVVADVWDAPAGGDGAWTTVAHWSAYGAVRVGEETYGQKDVEFRRFAPLARLVPYPLEIAVDADDADELRTAGWRLVDPLPVSRDPWSYRDYVWGSRGEFTVAKNAYVKTRSGWFSDRTATYLASGRPAVVQDTGLNGALAGGEGLLLYRTLDEAASALALVESDYEGHCAAARALAAEYFDAGRVLTRLLDECGV